MSDFRAISDTQNTVLRRVESLCQLPTTVARDVREAIKQYEMAVARAEIVQQPGVKPYCAHVCSICGERV
jgi:hypothetical protein